MGKSFFGWLFFFYKFLVTFGDIDFGLQNVAFENGVFNSGRRTECLFFKKNQLEKWSFHLSKNKTKYFSASATLFRWILQKMNFIKLQLGLKYARENDGSTKIPTWGSYFFNNFFRLWKNHAWIDLHIDPCFAIYKRFQAGGEWREEELENFNLAINWEHLC